MSAPSKARGRTPPPPDPTTPDLAQLLGTADKTQQALIVREMIMRVNMPTLGLVILSDVGKGTTTLQPVGDLSFDGLQQLLNDGNQELMRMRLEAMQKQQEAAQAGSSDGTGDAQANGTEGA